MEIITINPKDKIMITFQPDCDLDSALEVKNYFAKYFPDNTIISNFSGFVKDFTIIRDYEELITPGEKKEPCDGHIY